MGSGWVKITGKSVTFKSGRSVEVYDRVFLGIFLLSGICGYSLVFPVISWYIDI